MHPDGFPVPQERDFYWKAGALSFTRPTTDKQIKLRGDAKIKDIAELKLKQGRRSLEHQP